MFFFFFMVKRRNLLPGGHTYYNVGWRSFFGSGVVVCETTAGVGRFLPSHLVVSFLGCCRCSHIQFERGKKEGNSVVVVVS